jgi:hypothetical protein
MAPAVDTAVTAQGEVIAALRRAFGA